MPAGRIQLTFPDPSTRTAPGAKAVIVEPAARLPKVPSLGQAWATAANEFKTALEKGGLRAAIGGSAEAFGAAGLRSALTVARGVSGILVAEVTAKIAASFVRRALEQTQIPEVARFNAATGMLAESIAGLVDRELVPAMAELAPAMRALERGPGVVVAAAGFLGATVRHATNLFVARAAAALVAPMQAAAIARFPRTAGLAQGGATIPGAAVSGAGAQIPGLPDVAISMPGAGLQFTSPQNVIAEDLTGSPRSALDAAGGVVAALAPIPANLVSAALDALTADLERVRSEAAARSVASGRDLAAAASPKMALDGLLLEMSAARSAALSASQAEVAIIKATVWDEAVETSRRVVADLEAGLRSALSDALAVTREFATAMVAATTGALAPVQIVSEDLGEALELDFSLVDRVAATSERAARVRSAIAMANVVVTAAVRGSIAFAKGVAELAAGDVPQASMHFAAAAAYAVAAGLAVAYGGGSAGAGRPSRDALPSETRFGSIADLVVIAPGISNPDRIRDEIARAIQSNGVKVGAGYSSGRRMSTRAMTAAELRDELHRLATVNGAGFAGLGLAALVGASGPIGWVVGAGLALTFGTGRAEREAGRVVRRIRHIF